MSRVMSLAVAVLVTAFAGTAGAQAPEIKRPDPRPGHEDLQPEEDPVRSDGEAVKMPAETLDSVGLRKSGNPVIYEKQPDEPPPPDVEAPPKKKAAGKSKPR